MITMNRMFARLVHHHRVPIKLASSSGERVLLLLAFPRNSGFDVFLLCRLSCCLASSASFASASTAASFSKIVIGGTFSFFA